MFDKKKLRSSFGVHEEEQLDVLRRMRSVVENMVFKNKPGGSGQEGKLPFQVRKISICNSFGLELNCNI